MIPTHSVSVEHRADGNVGVRLYRFIPRNPRQGEPDEHERHEYLITHEDAWHLLGQLTGVLRYQSGERVCNTAAGDCSTCNNHRLIYRPVKGADRMESVHCPDCYPRYLTATPAYPRPSGAAQ